MNLVGVGVVVFGPQRRDGRVDGGVHADTCNVGKEKKKKIYE